MHIKSFRNTRFDRDLKTYTLSIFILLHLNLSNSNTKMKSLIVKRIFERYRFKSPLIDTDDNIDDIDYTDLTPLPIY